MVYVHPIVLPSAFYTFLLLVAHIPFASLIQLAPSLCVKVLSSLEFPYRRASGLLLLLFRLFVRFAVFSHITLLYPRRRPLRSQF